MSTIPPDEDGLLSHLGHDSAQQGTAGKTDDPGAVTPAPSNPDEASRPGPSQRSSAKSPS